MCLVTLSRMDLQPWWPIVSLPHWHQLISRDLDSNLFTEQKYEGQSLLKYDIRTCFLLGDLGNIDGSLHFAKEQQRH